MPRPGADCIKVLEDGKKRIRQLEKELAFANKRVVELKVECITPEQLQVQQHEAEMERKYQEVEQELFRIDLDS